MITPATPIKIGQNSWLLTWTSDLVGTPMFRVYVDGLWVSTQFSNQFTLYVENGKFPLIEILDDIDALPQRAFPAYLYFGWQSDPDAANYLIQQNVSAAWMDIATLTSGDGEWMSYSTPALADDTTHQWRVIPIDAAGNQGTPLAFSGLMVRYPDPPQAAFVYDPITGTVTIS